MLKTISVFVIALLSNAKADRNARDPSSFSNTAEVSTTYLALDLKVMFDTKTIQGKAMHIMQSHIDDLSTVTFDYDNLNITKCEYASRTSGMNFWKPLSKDQCKDNQTIEGLGTQLLVTIPDKRKVNETFALRFTYTTLDPDHANPKGQIATSWLNKDSTTDSEHFLYTQCQDIACRSLAPLQDTPSNKFQWEVKVNVQEGLTAFMSADSTGNETINGRSIFYFSNQVPTSSYVIALVVGNLQFNMTEGSRNVGVISEPSMTNASLAALKDLQIFLDTAQEYVNETTYQWKEYKIVVLPPFFPMGGMENPQLTFASPTIITEDRSQVYVATHEIVHSWTGNTVTCRNWNHLWLNEGFTVFIERKVSAAISGGGFFKNDDFAREEAYIGQIAMMEDINNFIKNNQPAYAQLYPNVDSEDPNFSFSEVPYEKGFAFLWNIEQTFIQFSQNDSVVGQEVMKSFINGWVKNKTNQAAIYTELKSFFEDFVTLKFQDQAETIKKAIDWEAWINDPTQIGIPSTIVQNFTTSSITKMQELAQAYLDSNASGTVDHSIWANSTSNQKVVFISEIMKKNTTFNTTLMEFMDNDLSLTAGVDPEVRQRWLQLAIYQSYKAADNEIEDVVSKVGRQKYLKPIYQATIQMNLIDKATKWLADNKNKYHPSTVIALQNLFPKQTEQIMI